MKEVITTILGAGITGLSTSYHLGHNNAIIFEKRPVHGGHAGSDNLFGFTVDQGPHVSFTKHQYVRDLFVRNTQGQFLEYPVRTRNFYQGSWIEHPAQAHLWQVPQPLRERCTEEMLVSANNPIAQKAENYQEWLELAFGKTFAANFPCAYTRKYWTTDAVNLSVDWLGPRMPKLDASEIQSGLVEGAYQKLHYITSIRYPEAGGYQSFFDSFALGANIHLGMQIASIDLKEKKVWFTDGKAHLYEQLVSTLPLPEFVNACRQVNDDIREAVQALDCSQLLIIDVFAPHEQQVEGHWFYVYDENKWATRIHCVERLAPANAPQGWTGVQVEVYFSDHKPFPGNPSMIAAEVLGELVEMGFVLPETAIAGAYKIGWRWSNYANVIFTHPRREALDKIWNWMENYGLIRQAQDLDATTDWSRDFENDGCICMAGRFAEWKYHWTDDCVLRGQKIKFNRV